MKESWNPNKIKKAIRKSYERYLNSNKTNPDIFDENQENRVVLLVEKSLLSKNIKEITVIKLHEEVLEALYRVNHNVYAEYRAYRNYKEIFKKSFNDTYNFSKKIINEGDKENANKDSSLNSTRQALISEAVMKEFMLNFELNPTWVEAHNNGYIHIHDLGSRFLNSHNCCLFDMKNLLKGGFELNGIKYTEPTSIQSAFNVAGDVILSASAQQYGGFSVTNVDKIFSKYANLSYDKALNYFKANGICEIKSKILAENQVIREIEQGYQAFEVKLNTVSNALGQTPFVTISMGMDTSKWGQKISEIILKTRKNGIGEKKTTAVFPKLIFLHRNEICGYEGTPNYYIKKLAIECSSTMLYPDWVSIDDGYQAEVYEESGQTVTPMGCRAFLGKFYNSSGQLIYEGRGNIGAVTLNLPLYALESNKDLNRFYELIKKYSKMAFDIHLMSYEKIGKSKGSTNPLFYCEGGAWKSVGYDEEIAPVLEGFTASLGYIGLEETCQALFEKPLMKCLDFGIDVVKYLNKLVDEYKEKYNKLFTLYATPAESLIERFQNINREKFGIIKNVTDRGYMTNSFHQGVWINHIPPVKMLLEKPMFDLTPGGRITYCEYPYSCNLKVLEDNINFAMKLGLYNGINIESSTCQDCGERGEFEVCPSCASLNVTSVNRCCGYLSFSKVKGQSRYNKGKREEIKDRVDHIWLE